MAESAPTPHPHQTEGHDDPFLAHHFESHGHQLEAGKLGMWIFLVTEILLFGGLFCVYAVYRANNPEVFYHAYQQQYLDTTLGAINTAVLIFSSLTMAWGVRCAQCNQPRGLVVCLAITLACGGAFLGVKYVEYKHKWEEKLLPGKHFDPVEHAAEAGSSAEKEPEEKPENEEREPTAADVVPVAIEEGDREEEAKEAEAAPEEDYGEASSERPDRVRIFFSVYFLMTGLHAIHVIAGMGAISWILVRAVKRHFSSRYFGPVDYVGLYWHVVDMVWIFLFPLFYLIH
ncbi:MAG: cytochrome c oxidase subunit 3 family protein [Planctomycetota bacterium]|jgi:cytochrome c oxidase subunit 3